MKRWIVLLFALTLLLTACAKQPDPAPEIVDPMAAEEQPPEPQEELPEEAPNQMTEAVTPEAPDDEQTPDEPAELPDEDAEQPDEPEEPPVEPETPPAEQPATPPTQPEPAEQPADQPAPPQEQPAETEPETPPSTAPRPTLEELSDEILRGTDYVLEKIPVDAESFSFYLFIDPIDGATALAREPLIGTSPTSIVLLQLPEGQDAAAVASQVEQNADPNKWVCTTADTVVTASKGRFVLLAMGPEELTSAVQANFLALDWDLD